jgi:hypothetical protein
MRNTGQAARRGGDVGKNDRGRGHHARPQRPAGWFPPAAKTAEFP